MKNTSSKKSEKNIEIKFVGSFYEKNKIESVDAFDVQKYLTRILNNSNKNIEDKDDIIKALIYEYSLLAHFIAKSHPEYIDFLNQVKNKEMLDDDSLEWCLNPPQIKTKDLNPDYKPGDISEMEKFEWDE